MAEISYSSNNNNISNKRCREENQEEDTQNFPESSEAKRIRETLLFDSIEDITGPDNTDIVSVMKILEAEMLLPVSDSDLLSLSDPDSNSGSLQPDLGYLFEASDEDLGIPPADGDVSSGEGVAADVGVIDEIPADDVEAKIWGISDDFNFDFGMLDDGGFDGAVFDNGDSDFADLTWQTDFLPAN